MWGYSVQVYFDPGPGTIPRDISTINGVIDVSGQFTGYVFTIDLLMIGASVGDEIIESYLGSVVDGSNMTLWSSDTSWHKEFPLEVPKAEIFSCFMMVTFSCWGYELEHDDKAAKVQADYTKTSVKNNNINLSDTEIVYFSILIIKLSAGISIFVLIKSRSRESVPSDSMVDEKISQIQKILDPVFDDHGNFKVPDITNEKIKLHAGDLTLLHSRKEALQAELAKLPLIHEQKELLSVLTEHRASIVKNPLFALLSSHFLRSSRKRENCPVDDFSINQVRHLKESFKDGRWNGLENPQIVVLAASVCLSYLQAHKSKNDLNLLKELDIPVESERLANRVKKYQQFEKKHQVTYNDLMIQQESNMQTANRAQEELERIDSVLIEVRKYLDNNYRSYRNDCLRFYFYQPVKNVVTFTEIYFGNENFK